ncbi:MAG: hypothetical protein WCR42_09230 [bacterium]
MFGRHNRFKSRIEIERNVLSIVNKTYSNINPLEGLTHASIAKWATQMDNSKLYILLFEISNMSSLHNDCSRDIFSEEEMDLKVGLYEKIDSLHNFISKLG